MNAGLGGWAPDHTDSFPWALPGAGVGLGALAADRQTAQVAYPAIALDALQPFQVHADLAAQVAFDYILAVLDRVHYLRELLLGQVLCPDGGFDIRSREDLSGIGGPNPVNVTQGDVDAFVGRDFDADNTSHKCGKKLKLVVSPDAACGGRWCRSHAQRLCGGRFCNSHKAF